MTYTDNRIHNKSDAGTYTYQSGNHRIDELAAVAGYAPPQHDLTYTAEGKVKTITETTDTATVKLFTFTYGLGNERFSMEYKLNDTLTYTRYYFDTYEKEVRSDGTVRHLNYIYALNGLVAVYSDSMYFVYTDQLGSLRCTTDSSGVVKQMLSFDVWGNRRNPVNGEKDSTLTASLLFARGFTGHEHLDEVGLINMNGRVYDPMLGMFISPDNYVQAPDFTQNFNRYAYCLNNPLMYTDPSGNKFTPWHLLAASVFGVASWQSIMGLENGSLNGWQAAGLYLLNAGSFILGAGASNGLSSLQMGGTFMQGFTGSCIANPNVFTSFKGGFATGFFSGTGTSLINGEDFGTAFRNGVERGFVTGTMAGLMNGISNLLTRHEYKFKADRPPINGKYFNEKAMTPDEMTEEMIKLKGDEVSKYNVKIKTSLPYGYSYDADNMVYINSHGNWVGGCVGKNFWGTGYNMRFSPLFTTNRIYWRSLVQHEFSHIYNMELNLGAMYSADLNDYYSECC